MPISLQRGSESNEIDLLIADRGSVTVCECKLRATGLTSEQAEATVLIASELNAKVVFAALEDDFTPEVGDYAAAQGVRLLSQTDLLAR